MLRGGMDSLPSANNRAVEDRRRGGGGRKQKEDEQWKWKKLKDENRLIRRREM